MSKYIDADRLRVEIEQRLDELNPKKGMFGDRPLRAVNPKTFPRESELEKVLGIIDSLQQEQPELPGVELEEEIIRWLGEGDITDTRLDDYDDSDIERTARHFAEWGAIHLNARK